MFQKKRGYTSGGAVENYGCSGHTSAYSDGDNDDVSIQTESAYIYVQSTVCACRTAKNRLLMTWNSAPILGELYCVGAIYRILTSRKPTNNMVKGDINNCTISEGVCEINGVEAQPSFFLNDLGDHTYINITKSVLDAYTDGGDNSKECLYSEYIDVDDTKNDNHCGHYSMYLFVYQTTADFNLNKFTYRYYYDGIQLENNCISSAPDISLTSDSSLTIGKSMVGRRIIEFHKTSIPYGAGIGISDNEEVLNEFLLATMINEEKDYDDGGEYDSKTFYKGYFVHDTAKSFVVRWSKGTHTVSIQAEGNDDYGNYENIVKIVKSKIKVISDFMNESFGITFKYIEGDTGDISVIIGDMKTLFGKSPDLYFAQAGSWSYSWDGYGNICDAVVKLSNDFYEECPYITYEDAAMEELLQTMGVGFDQYEYIVGTLHSSFRILNTDSISILGTDSKLLNLLYSSNVENGYNCTDLSNTFNIPKGVYIPSTSTSDKEITVDLGGFLDSGFSYEVRTFVVNGYGKVSYTSDWITVEMSKAVQPEPWKWTSDVTVGAQVGFSEEFHGLAPLTATEWNEFTKRINETRLYRDAMDGTSVGEYTFTEVGAGTEFTASIYDEAVAAIKGISGGDKYGTYVHYAKGNSLNVLASSTYTSLANELNAAMGYTDKVYI